MTVRLRSSLHKLLCGMTAVDSYLGKEGEADDFQRSLPAL